MLDQTKCPGRSMPGATQYKGIIEGSIQKVENKILGPLNKRVGSGGGDS